MVRITIDDAMRDKLAGADGCTELCDSSGNVVGYFTRKVDKNLEPQVSEEELERREAETKLYTFDEVMEHLRNL